MPRLVGWLLGGTFSICCRNPQPKTTYGVYGCQPTKPVQSSIGRRSAQFRPIPYLAAWRGLHELKTPIQLDADKPVDVVPNPRPDPHQIGRALPRLGVVKSDEPVIPKSQKLDAVLHLLVVKNLCNAARWCSYLDVDYPCIVPVGHPFIIPAHRVVAAQPVLLGGHQVAGRDLPVKGPRQIVYNL